MGVIGGERAAILAGTTQTYGPLNFSDLQSGIRPNERGSSAGGQRGAPILASMIAPASPSRRPWGARAAPSDISVDA
jgi:hypothetical protein